MEKKNNIYSSLSPKKIVILLIVLILIIIIAISCFGKNDKTETNTISPEVFKEATVVKIVDGDTIWIDGEDGNDKVRLIGIDAPEIDYYSSEKTDGDLSSEFLESILTEGQTVYLQADVSDDDSYNRLLRYIWTEIPTDKDNEDEISTKMLNAIILINGYAKAIAFEPDTRYSDLFDKLQTQAEQEKSGLWRD